MQDSETGSLSRIPEANGCVHSARDQECPIRAKSDRSHPPIMALQGSEASSRSPTALFPDLPEFHATIIATTGQDRAIRAERKRPGHPAVSPEGHERFAISHAPDADLTAETANRQIVPVRTEHHGSNAFNRFHEEGISDIRPGETGILRLYSL